MSGRMMASLVLMIVCVWTVGNLSAQRPGFNNDPDDNPLAQNPADPNQDPNANPNGNANNGQNQPQGEDEVRNEGPPRRAAKLPDDPRLVDVYRTFVINAEKLAADYIKNEQYDKAKVVYEEVVRLVPSYDKGKGALEDIKRRQSNAERKEVVIKANAEWQDTGVVVAEGKPVTISANGTWNFRVASDVSADGMEVPKELQDFNLGALVGMIDDGNPKDNKPFFVGSHNPFTARRTGRLMLRMYDFDPSDNVGKLEVTITGSFAQGGIRAPRRTTGGANANN